MPYDQSLDYASARAGSVMPVRTRLQMFNQISGNSTVTLSATQPTQVKIDIDSGNLNWYNSYVEWDLACAISGGNCGAVFVDQPHFESIRLVTRSNKVLAEVPFAIASKMIMHVNRPWIDSQSQPGWENTIAEGLGAGFINFNNLSATAALADAAAPADPIFQSCQRSTSTAATAVTGRDARALVQYVSGTAATAFAGRCRLSLRDLAGTLFGVDMWSPMREVCQLQLTYLPADNFAIAHTAIGTLAGAATRANVPTITNFKVIVPYLEDPDLAASLEAKIKQPGGLMVRYPALRVESRSMGTATSGSASVPLNLSDGDALLRVYSCEYITGGTLSLAQCCYNAQGTLTTAYLTKLGSQNLQPGTVSITAGDHWAYVDELIRGSVVQDHFTWSTVQGNMHIDDFVGGNPLIESRKLDSHAGVGLKLGPSDMIYTRTITKSAIDTTMYFVCVLQRKLRFTEVGIKLDSDA